MERRADRPITRYPAAMTAPARASRSPQKASPEAEKSDPATQTPPRVEHETPTSIHRSKGSRSQRRENKDAKSGVVLTSVTELAMVVILSDWIQQAK